MMAMTIEIRSVKFCMGICFKLKNSVLNIFMCCEL
jgi:hypothetical protein